MPLLTVPCNSRRPLPAKCPTTKNTAPHFTLRGQVLHASRPSWEFGILGLFDDQNMTMPLDSQGSFTVDAPLDRPEDLYLTDSAIWIFAVPGDTLTVTWDKRNFQSTFNVTTSNPLRQKEIDLMPAVDRKFRRPLFDLDCEVRIGHHIRGQLAGGPEEWKWTLAELHLDGVNALAEGWVNNPVCEDYEVNGLMASRTMYWWIKTGAS